jgi:hypothetical protein
MYDMSNEDDALQPLHDEAEREEYPSGLLITLDGDTLRKLALDVGDFKIGQVIDIIGQAEVVGIESSPRQIAGHEQSVELQITALSIGDDDDEEADDEQYNEPAPRSMAERLFG